jgi:Flp pilus assembly protein TadG
MQKFLQNRDGAAAVEGALILLPILLFFFGIIQTGYILWIDNLLHYSVDAAARCGAVHSTTYPCYGAGLANMQSTANTLFNPPGSATFATNTCSGSGLTGTYQVSILFVTTLTLTAKSCYPDVS